MACCSFTTGHNKTKEKNVLYVEILAYAIGIMFFALTSFRILSGPLSEEETPGFIVALILTDILLWWGNAIKFGYFT